MSHLTEKWKEYRMMNHLDALSSRSRDTPESGIMDIINYGMGREGLIPLWTGEGDQPTPEFIYKAVNRSLEAGETFYTWQRGIPELRQALADYHSRVYSKSFQPERFFVTGSGMQAIQLCIMAVTGPGDEIVIPTPTWPNFNAALTIGGGVPVEVPMEFNESGWSLDLDRISSAITNRTRALFLNTPCNPTGWVASREQLGTVLAMAREKGLWVIADEVYGKFYYGDDADRAPSFYDVMTPEDRIMFPNTFSKNWSMTGWRVGWISAPPELGSVFENLIQNSTSGVAAFMQHGCRVALDEGDEYLQQQVEIARQGRDLVAEALNGHNRVRFAMPVGSFYHFLKVDDPRNSLAVAKSIVDDVAVGFSPGSAFGAGGEGFLRLCFARQRKNIETALDRFCDWLGNG